MSSRRRSVRLQSRQTPTTHSRASTSRVPPYSPRRSSLSNPSYLLSQNVPSASRSRRTPTISTAVPSQNPRSPSSSPPASVAKSQPTLNSLASNSSFSPSPSPIGDNLASSTVSTEPLLPLPVRNPKTTTMSSPNLESDADRYIASSENAQPHRSSPAGQSSTLDADKDTPSQFSPTLAREIETDIERELQTLSTSHSSPSPFMTDTDTSNIATSPTSPHLASVDMKLDLLIEAQKHSIRTFDLASQRLISLESKFDALSSTFKTFLEVQKDTPNYNPHFSRIVDLFGRTFQSLDELDSKLSSSLRAPNTHSSGISFASSSADSSDELAPNANLASISLSKRPSHHHTNPPATKSPPASTSSTDEITSMNKTMLSILDKLVESKTSKPPNNVSFPTFTGTKDSLSFHRWITIVCGILSTSEWRALYNADTHSYVLDGSNSPTLNNHLYSSLLVKLKGPAADYASSRRDIHGDGVSLLEALRQSYRTVLTPSELVSVERKFNDHSRGRNQAIESFVTDLESMHHDILDNGGHSSRERLHRNFILGLGPEFSAIINHMNMGTLPLEWQCLDLHKLIPTAKMYLQSVLSTRQRNKIYKEVHKPPTTPASQASSSTSTRKQSNVKPPGPDTATEDRMKRIYTAIYHRKFKISDYEHEVGPGCCVFHGIPDHKSSECLAIQRAINKSKQNNASSTTKPVSATVSNPPQPVANVVNVPQPSLPQSVVSQIEAVDFSALQGNDCNNINLSSDDVNVYLALSSKSISLDNPNEQNRENKLKLILDSGAFPHMSNSRVAFDSFYD